MKYFRFALSTRISLVLLIAFALSCAVATFIENDHGTAAARSSVYEAWWFEVILLWLAVNFLAHIRQYKLLRPGRWPIGLFHIAFVVIILGAGVTRYFSTEGTIHIREGHKENTFYTNNRYLQFRQLGQGGGRLFEKPLNLISHNFKKQSIGADFGSEQFTVVFDQYIKSAKEEVTKGRDVYLDLAVTMGEGREDHLLKEGNTMLIGELLLATGTPSGGQIRIYKKDKVWMINADTDLQVLEMASQKMGVIKRGETKPLQTRALYQTQTAAFLVKAIHEGSALKYSTERDEKAAKNLADVVRMKVLAAGDQPVTDTYVRISKYDPAWHTFDHEGRKYSIAYGPRAERLPFSLYLKKFELERYPGSQSPESYASELDVIDAAGSFPYRVFMNNVLDHKGFRFYQSSYDSDERGTVLSVNQDRAGTYLTYLGYFLLGLGMVLTFFAKGSRFHLLNNKLGTIRQRVKRATLCLAFVCASFAGFSQTKGKVMVVPAAKAAGYGRLIVQDLDGRMKPLNTLANEILRKLNGKSTITLPSFMGDAKLNAEQFLLAVQLDPSTFSEMPIIRIDKDKSREAFIALGIKPTEKISFRQFLNKDGEYLLHELVEEANKLKPAERNEGHKELLKTDERFNIFYAVLTGDFLRIFPNRLDKNNTWFTSQQSQKGFPEEDAAFVGNITSLYLAGLQKGIVEGNWKQADEALSYMELFQQKAGATVYPDQRAIEAELLYNKLNLGSRLFAPLWLLGTLMLVLGIVMLFRESRSLLLAWRAGQVLAWAGLLIFSFHLGLRWYIAKHPPWTDGFEMLVFVAWGVLLFGLLFSGKSKFTVPMALLFSGTLLFVGFLDWLNPEITNLMPVLHSYWLKIHVAIIVSSYAPLALAAILALLSLMLLIFKPRTPTENWWASMQELSIVSEMAITVGLFLLAIGTFLGGVWANESWGRYWAWDPKETWALISVLVYAFVLHLRLVPAMRSALVFNLASLWGFSSIIMTSFGVNYYLSGLHSYAAGDPVPVPLWVYWVVALLLIISTVAVLKSRKMTDRDKKLLTI
ncbi:cytochrome c biogenesis protein CcsA [Arcticibacter sp. MXS-1]|uniref:cytochrome c biogenesis protein n=1 Tax=Arcticibacter sp. MXS-1 TaxID=3341726 RepID=UPI0035A8C172